MTNTNKNLRNQIRLRLEQAMDIPSMQQTYYSIVELDGHLPHVKTLQTFKGVDDIFIGTDKEQI